MKQLGVIVQIMVFAVAAMAVYVVAYILAFYGSVSIAGNQPGREDKT